MSRPWDRGDGRRWRDVLDLLAAPWIRAYLADLGIPQAVAARPDLLRALRDRAARDAPAWEQEGSTVGDSVAGALREVATATTDADAAVLERWLRRHALCRDALPALHTWQAVLLRSGRPPGGLYDRIEPPPALGPHAAEIQERLDAGERRATKLDATDVREAPAAAVERAAEIVRLDAVADLLADLGARLGPDRADVVAWAEDQAVALDLIAAQLAGSRFLDRDPACADGPPPVAAGPR